MDSFNSNKNKHLISLIKFGDIGAFERLYHLFYPKLFAFSLRYFKVKEDAEGMTQEVFIELWKNKEKLNKNLSLSSFLFTIMRNKIIDHFRKEEKKAIYTNYLKSLVQSNNGKSFEFPETVKANKKMRSAINELTEKRRAVFLLSKKFGLSRKEIAEFMGVSENTVKNQLQEAIKFLRAALSNKIAIIIILFFIF